MAMIDVVKFEGKPDELVGKFHTDQITWGAQLIVNESQEAIFFKGGKALDVFGPGTHTLKTGNIPLLEKLVNIPFGGDTPFAAEVWFVNKRAFNELGWGTKSPIQVQDPKYGLFVPVRAYGQYGIKIENSQQFVQEVVGTQQKTSTDDISGFLRGIIASKLSDIIAELIEAATVNILNLSTQTEEVGEAAKTKLQPTFEKYGLQLIEFFAESLNVPMDDPSVQKLKSALADKAELDILGDRYQQKRMLDIGMAAAENEGGTAGAGMGAGMGMGMGMNMGQMMGGMGMGAMNTQAPQADPTAKLGQLKKMLDQQLITQTEYDTKKQQILSTM